MKSAAREGDSAGAMDRTLGAATDSLAKPQLSARYHDLRGWVVKQGVRLGRVGSVPVYLRPSWFLVAIAITVLFAPTARDSVELAPGADYLVAFGFAVILLLSVFVHELAHAAAAAATGTPATHIVLDLWGGHTAFEREARSPGRSITVAAVGPLTNGIIAWGAGQLVAHAEPFSVTRLLLLGTATSNAAVAVFNALPGLPLDGGRVLAGLVWWVRADRLLGALVAGWSGRLLALGLAGWAVVGVVGGSQPWTAAIWLLLIAGLLWQGAGQAIEVALWYRRTDRARIDELLQPAVSVASTATVATALLAAADAGASAVVVLDVYGRPALVVDERAAAEVPVGRADQVGASAVAEALPEGAVLETGLHGEDLINRLEARPATRYAVVNPEERVVGVLDWEDVAAFVSR
jgi:Zn-dependent protease